jgi:sulfoquinovosidase
MRTASRRRGATHLRRLVRGARRALLGASLGVPLGVLLGLTACEPSGVVVVGDRARATLELSPLRVFVDDADGARVLTLEGVHGARDLYFEEPQLLPGWDGYREGVDRWLLAGEATVLEQDAARAVLRIAGGEQSAGGTLTVTAAGDRVRLSFALDPPLPGAPQKSSLTFTLGEDEAFFGLGERFASLNHRGQSLYSWAEEGGLGGGEDPARATGSPFPNGPSMTYFPVPFFLSSAGYAIRLDTTRRSELHFGTESPAHWRAAVNGGAFDVVVYVAPPLQALDLYTEDTGRPMIPAPWVFGPRRRVSPGRQVDGVDEWRLLRERGVPTTGLDDAVHFLPHLSHAGREEELQAWTTALHAAGFKVMAYNNPYVSASVPAARADFEHGRENGLFLLDELGRPGETFFISGEPQTLATIDLTSRAGVEWFQELLRRTLALGYDGWMHDFGEYVARTWTASNGMTGEELHNLFPVLSARAAFELLEEERPGDWLIFVRSGYAGTQAFVPAVWGGDAEATFDETQGIPSALRSGLSLGMSGVPYWGSDTSGFKCLTSDPRDKEMYLRWAALSAVSPIMMEQNACVNPLERRSKWTLWSDEETTAVYGAMARLHTRLQPYFEVLARDAHATGAPLMRHPFLIHPDDPQAIATEEAFYLGPALWAAPVVRRGQTQKVTWIPPGQLVDLDDGTVYDGGRVVSIPAPLDKLPLLLIAGHMLPLLDESIETLAEADDPLVVTPSRVADRLDVIVALRAAQRAELRLADGTRLSALPTSEADTALDEVEAGPIRDCARCISRDRFGGVRRLRATGDSAASSRIVVDGTALEASGPVARRMRFTLLRLP